jgi:hypothetical protein
MSAAFQRDSDNDTYACSDISEFAAWELAHPLGVGDVHEQSREQSLIDMAQPERIWRGEDSSNDPRSEDEDMEIVKDVVVNEVRGGEGRKAEEQSPRKDFNGESIIPSSTQISAQSASQGSDGTVKGQSQDLQGRKLVSCDLH